MVELIRRREQQIYVYIYIYKVPNQSLDRSIACFLLFLVFLFFSFFFLFFCADMSSYLHVSSQVQDLRRLLLPPPLSSSRRNAVF